MLKIEHSNPSPEPSFPATLAALSRNASVISTSESSSDSGPSLLLRTPLPRPIRNFSSPRSSSPQAPSPHAPKPPSYLTKELGHSGDSKAAVESNAKARSKSRPRNTAVNVQDFHFGATLGEGSYSTVSFFQIPDLVYLALTVVLTVICYNR
jgi:3-phosphoinositide dependent protein kinase-1